MSSITLTLSGNSSQLQAVYFPAIDLSDGQYVCGLIDFQTFNSIPNVDETNNLFYFGHENVVKLQKNNPKYDKDNNDIDQEFIAIDTQQSNKKVEFDDNNASLHYTIVNENDSQTKSRKKRAIVKTKLPLSHLETPTGSYEVEDLAKYLKKYLTRANAHLELEANKNTLQCEIMCSPLTFLNRIRLDQFWGLDIMIF